VTATGTSLNTATLSSTLDGVPPAPLVTLSAPQLMAPCVGDAAMDAALIRTDAHRRWRSFPRAGTLLERHTRVELGPWATDVSLLYYDQYRSSPSALYPHSGVDIPDSMSSDDGEPPELLEIDSDTSADSLLRMTPWGVGLPITSDATWEHFAESILPLFVNTLARDVTRRGTSWIEGEVRFTCAVLPSLSHPEVYGPLFSESYPHLKVLGIPLMDLPPTLDHPSRTKSVEYHGVLRYVAHPSAQSAEEQPRWRVHHRYVVLPDHSCSGRLRPHRWFANFPALDSAPLSPSSVHLCTHMAAAVVNAAPMSAFAFASGRGVSRILLHASFKVSCPTRVVWATSFLPIFLAEGAESSFQMLLDTTVQGGSHSSAPPTFDNSITGSITMDLLNLPCHDAGPESRTWESHIMCTADDPHGSLGIGGPTAMLEMAPTSLVWAPLP
jgi:hypothetical protein